MIDNCQSHVHSDLGLFLNLIVVCLFHEFYYPHIFSHLTQLFNFSHYLQTAAKVHSLLKQCLVLFIIFDYISQQMSAEISLKIS